MNSSESDSMEEAMKALGFQQTIWVVQVVILFLLFLVGFCGNMTVLLMLFRNRLAVNRTIRLLIMNLVIADLMVVTFCILTLAIWHYTIQWLGGDFLCRFSKYMQMFSLYASTFIITVISVDRCIAVAAPMSTARCTRRMIVMAWVLAAIFSIPQGFIFRVQQPPPSLTDMVFYQCVTFGSYTAAWQEQLYASFTLCVNFIIPLNTIIICYAIILHKLLIHGAPSISTHMTFKNGLSQHCHGETIHNTRNQLNTNSSLNQRTARLRKARTTSLWISVLIVVTFVICWGPYYARMIGAFFWDESASEPSSLDNFVFFFGMSNSVINPVIYGAFHIIKRSKIRVSTRQASSCRTDLSNVNMPMLTRQEAHKKSPKQFNTIIKYHEAH